MGSGTKTDRQTDNSVYLIIYIILQWYWRSSVR